jgi:hypothetical protein
MRIFNPQLLVIIIEAHERENYLKEDDVHLGLHQLVQAILGDTTEKIEILLSLICNKFN